MVSTITRIPNYNVCNTDLVDTLAQCGKIYLAQNRGINNHIIQIDLNSLVLAISSQFLANYIDKVLLQRSQLQHLM
jgi:hypothetical protein